jgi:ribosomal protein S18 acetylase RimI-like enzyme
MSVNAKLFQTIFNRNPKYYTDAEKKEMIAITRKAIMQKAIMRNAKDMPARSNDTILFLRGDNVEKVMDMSKINTIYNECFKSDLYINPSHIYAFYIVGASVTSVVSMLTIDKTDVSSVTLWNVCKDLRIKGGYTRMLMDASLDYIRKKYIHKKLGVKKVQLYVLKNNSYYDKAVALYKSRGFKIDTRFVSEYGDKIRMSYRF